MPYATVDDMIAAFGEAPLVELTDRAGTGNLDTEVLAAAMARAEAEVDGYLKQRYPAGLNTESDLVRGIVCDLCRYNLYVSDAPETVVERKQNAVRQLQSIAAGRLSLGVVNAPPAAEVFLVSRPKVFNGGLR